MAKSFPPWKGRLNANSDYWSSAEENPSHPWIGVDFRTPTTVKGIITQGGVGIRILNVDWLDSWIKTLQIQYRDSQGNLVYILEGNSPKVSIA